MDKGKGYINISREIFSKVLFTEKRVFSKFEALIDLMQMARYSDKEAQQLIGGKVVTWGKNQIPASNRYLQERWKWSNTKVKLFLEFLVAEGEIKISQNAGQTVISVLQNLNNIKSTHQKRQQENGSNTQQDCISEDSNDTENDTENDAETTEKRQRNDETVIKDVNKGEIKEENKGEREGTRAHDLLLKEYEEFEEWVKANCPRVQQMKEPITPQQLKELRKKYQPKDMAPVLTAMQNRDDLFKNRSAYYVIDKWMKNEKKKNQSTSSGATSSQTEPKLRIPELGIYEKQKKLGTSEARMQAAKNWGRTEIFKD